MRASTGSAGKISEEASIDEEGERERGEEEATAGTDRGGEGEVG